MDPEEEARFSVYVTARRDQARRTAYLMCGDWHQADDLTQIAFVKLYGAWTQIRDYGALDAFVRRCLMRATVDESRRPWRREHATAELPEVTDISPISGDLASGVVAREIVRQALQQVPAGQRAILVLRYYQGLDVAATAAALECSEGNVKSQTARGLAALKAALARQTSTPGGSS